ncbi:Qat anti-phage system associated protein QatB [Noviherbaspirillum sp. CPCC 100848]|uniref:Qat anti-phage system associated protein QatB n=1 Tax=Noviherbaspirillum album TaxID=3080276 RepID=A0ABU6JIG6_9BURK|nr:Qat anti-phage system associated protein QatB [Noviherbaspirillum sp. CPCC 100848]MEC4723315.1 Qat anti-phage system associated protein QatB [Noviherbaspirillum sp. CPCC 100848]
MGTSTAFGGQPGSTPLVPSWVDDSPAGGASTPPTGRSDGEAQSSPGGNTPVLPAIPAIADPSRFSSARNNFSRFVGSGGGDRRSLGRAVSQYVSSSTGGSRTAAARMGSSRASGGRLLGFLSDAATRGAVEALRSLDLEALAGRPIEEVFLGLVEYICPDGGSIDEGIAREAFIETITDLVDAGITDINAITVDQVQMVFELYATNAIEARLCNDIGARTITLPRDAREAARIQEQLHDFIQRGVADALSAAQAAMATLRPDTILRFVDDIYEQAFSIMKIMGDAEADGV